MRGSVIRVSRRSLVAAAGVVALVGVIVILSATGVLARVFDPVAVAPAATVAAQQSAAERDVARAYEQAVDQVLKVRRLNLAITAQQADAVATKALADLKTLRHSAFVAMGQLLAMTAADTETYAIGAESRFDRTPVAGLPSPSPVLLAPRLYSIVSTMSEVSTQISDKATADLTAPAPAPIASPTASPRPSTPSPSPTR